MKIVHICLGFPIEFPGGITNYVASLSRMQGQLHDVVVYSGENKRKFSRVDKGAFINKRYNSKIRNFSLDLFAKDDSVYELFENLKRENADIYHFHSVLGTDLRLIQLFSKGELNYVVSFHDYNMLCPRVYMVDKWDQTCHEVISEKCQKCIGSIEQIDIFNKIADKINVRLPSIKSSKIDQRHTIFNEFLKNSRGNFAVSERVKEIYTFYDDISIEAITIGNESAKYFMTKHYDDIDNLTIAFLGSFDIKKGAKIFIDMCKASKSNAKFVVYGRGDEKLIKEFEECGGEYRGTYTPDNLSDILNKVHIGCVLSIWEDNGPQVTMELINSGIPTIGTNRGGIPDFILPNNGLVIEPSNVSDAVRWIDSMTVDKLNDICAKLTPLKTPEYHSNEMIDRYECIQK